jgi:hypothetical protein
MGRRTADLLTNHLISRVYVVSDQRKQAHVKRRSSSSSQHESVEPSSADPIARA